MTEVLSLLLASLFVSVSYAAELMVPVGTKGNDSVTFIREDDGLGNYDVGYNENVLTGGASFHRERGYANGTRSGAYGYTTRNGLIRIVTYVADQDGYRAEVLTNEPGVLPYSPSNVTFTKEREPDPAALAQAPTGYLDPEASSTEEKAALVGAGRNGRGLAEARSDDAVRDYVVGSTAGGGSEQYDEGHARVAVSSPFGGYQYAI